MSWWIPVVLRIFVGLAIGQYVFKVAIGLPSRTKRFFMQFMFCALFAILFAYAQNNLLITNTTLVIVGIGFLNGLAAYCHWKAMDISVSKNGLFTIWDDVIAMTLSYIVLNEGKFLNGGIILGIATSIAAVIFFLRHNYKKRIDGKGVSGVFFFYVGFYSVVWGVAVFLMRYFAFHKVPTGTFVSAWYGGALLAATLLLLFYQERGGGENKPSASVQERLKMLIWGLGMSIIIYLNMIFSYWALQLAPQTVVQPIDMVAEMIIPALIGIVFFAERQQFDKKDAVYFCLGVVGSILIALSYSG